MSGGSVRWSGVSAGHQGGEWGQQGHPKEGEQDKKGGEGLRNPTELKKEEEEGEKKRRRMRKRGKSRGGG